MMQSHKIAALCAALLSGAARLAGQTPGALLADSGAPERTVLPNAGIDVPMLRLRPGDSRPVVQVAVNGRGPYRFVIETGGRLVAVSRKLASQLALPKIAGPDELPVYHVDSITIEGASFQSISVTVLFADSDSVDGLLGLPMFQDVTAAQ